MSANTTSTAKPFFTFSQLIVASVLSVFLALALLTLLCFGVYVCGCHPQRHHAVMQQQPIFQPTSQPVVPNKAVLLTSPNPPVEQVDVNFENYDPFQSNTQWGDFSNNVDKFQFQGNSGNYHNMDPTRDNSRYIDRVL